MLASIYAYISQMVSYILCCYDYVVRSAYYSYNCTLHEFLMAKLGHVMLRSLSDSNSR
jgi:hypothetical protein